MATTMFGLVVVALVVASAAAHHEFTVHRAIQYDVAGERFGSRSSHVNLPGAVGESTPTHSIRLLQPCLDSEQVDLDTNSSATLVLLPKDPSPSQISCLKSMELSILSREWNQPIYFAFEDSETKKIAGHVAANTHGRYQFTVSTAEAQPAPLPRFTNLHGWLSGRSDAREEIIAVVAGWDSFSAVPGLTSGDASSVAAILEMMRVFRRIRDTEGLGKYSFLFVVTGSSALDGLGSKKFLSSVDARVLENLQLVICLDWLSNDKLYIHSTLESTQSAVFVKFQNAMLRSAKEAGMEVETFPKEIASSDDQAQFEHNHFAKEHLFAVTVSGRPSLPEHRFRISSMFDDKVSCEKVARSTNVIVEALARYIFDVEDAGLAQGSLSVNVDSLSSWMNYLHSQPTIAAALPKESSVIDDLRQELDSFLEDVKADSFDDGTFRVFADIPKRLSAFQVKPFLFDIGLIAGVSAYLASFYFTCKHFAR